MNNQNENKENRVNLKKERILHFVLDIVGVAVVSAIFLVIFPVIAFVETGDFFTDDPIRYISACCIFAVGLIIVFIKHLRKGPPKKTYYAEGSFKAEFLGHKCTACGSKMKIKKRSKVVARYSDEGRYYDFGTRYYDRFSRKSFYIEDYHKGQIVSECKFFHEAYYCPHCDVFVEFVTQHSLDKIDKHFKKRCKKQGLNYKKAFLDKDGNELSFPRDIENISLCHVTLLKGQEAVGVYKFPVKRLDKNDRAHYFDVSSIK